MRPYQYPALGSACAAYKYSSSIIKDALVLDIWKQGVIEKSCTCQIRQNITESSGAMDHLAAAHKVEVALLGEVVQRASDEHLRHAAAHQLVLELALAHRAADRDAPLYLRLHRVQLRPLLLRERLRPNRSPSLTNE